MNLSLFETNMEETKKEKDKEKKQNEQKTKKINAIQSKEEIVKDLVKEYDKEEINFEEPSKNNKISNSKTKEIEKYIFVPFVKKLWEITDEFLKVDTILEENPEIAEQYIEQLQMEFKEKVENIVGLLKYWDSVIETIKKEIKKLQDIQNIYMNKKETLKKYLIIQMKRLNINKIILSNMQTVMIRKGQPKVIIEDINKIPDEYVRIKKEPDKKKIKDALLNGELNPIDHGVYIEIGEDTIVIK